ncbi:hypothetical protein TWF506_009511 [Arthrobotrys conoides]|uniref:protein S-acyltransferase n=1 Tax=Arthrobotrys conoides TaxID=74498 RepID=A0AAN8RWC0_9PEZI
MDHIALRIAEERGREISVVSIGYVGTIGPGLENEVPGYSTSNHKQLWEWAQENTTTILVYLVGKNADDIQGPDGRTSLCWAAFHGNIDAVSLLLNNNADRNIYDKNGYTPLLLAAE